MSLHPRSMAYLKCDQCGTEGPEARTGVEVRGLAYSLGWSFPPRTLKRGGDSAARSYDVCPDCTTKEM